MSSAFPLAGRSNAKTNEYRQYEDIKQSTGYDPVRPHMNRSRGPQDFQSRAEQERYDGGENAPIYDRGFQKQDYRKKKANFFEEPQSRYDKPYGNGRRNTRESSGQYAREDEDYRRSRSRSNPQYGNYENNNYPQSNNHHRGDSRGGNNYRNADNNPGSNRDYGNRG